MTVLPYGAWPSPITAEMLATAGVGLSEPLLDDGIVYWIEQRPTEGGRAVVCKGDPHTAPVDVTPPGFDARTRVHEYGGGRVHGAPRDGLLLEPAGRPALPAGRGSRPEPITPDTDGRTATPTARSRPTAGGGSACASGTTSAPRSRTS